MSSIKNKTAFMKAFLDGMSSFSVGCVGRLGIIYQFLDILLAALVIPNMIGVLVMSSEVRQMKEEFFISPGFYGK